MGSGLPLCPAWDVSHGLVPRPDRGRALPVSPWAACGLPGRPGVQITLPGPTYVPTARRGLGAQPQRGWDVGGAVT